MPPVDLIDENRKRDEIYVRVPAPNVRMVKAVKPKRKSAHAEVSFLKERRSQKWAYSVPFTEPPNWTCFHNADRFTVRSESTQSQRETSPPPA